MAGQANKVPGPRGNYVSISVACRPRPGKAAPSACVLEAKDCVDDTTACSNSEPPRARRAACRCDRRVGGHETERLRGARFRVAELGRAEPALVRVSRPDRHADVLGYLVRRLPRAARAAW